MQNYGTLLNNDVLINSRNINFWKNFKGLEEDFLYSHKELLLGLLNSLIILPLGKLILNNENYYFLIKSIG